jgi:hypothetical protein
MLAWRPTADVQSRQQGQEEEQQQQQQSAVTKVEEAVRQKVA